MKLGNKWCTDCSHEHIPDMPRVTFACMDCGFGQRDFLLAGNHAVTYPRHTVYLQLHTLVDEEPKMKRITGFSGKKVHLSRNGTVSICGMLSYHSRNLIPDDAPTDLPLCGHCRKMDPDA